MIEAFLRYIYEPRKKRKKKEMHRAMNSPLEPTFFFFSIDHPSPKMKHTRYTGFLRRPQVHLQFVRTRGERGRGGKRMQRHNLPWLAMERSIRQRQQHFFEFRRPGPSMIAPSTHTHIHTHWRNVFPGSRFVVEVAAPSAGRKKDNGRKEWGSIS